LQHNVLYNIRGDAERRNHMGRANSKNSYASLHLVVYLSHLADLTAKLADISVAAFQRIIVRLFSRRICPLMETKVPCHRTATLFKMHFLQRWISHPV